MGRARSAGRQPRRVVSSGAAEGTPRFRNSRSAAIPNSAAALHARAAPSRLTAQGPADARHCPQSRIWRIGGRAVPLPCFGRPGPGTVRSVPVTRLLVARRESRGRIRVPGGRGNTVSPDEGYESFVVGGVEAVRLACGAEQCGFLDVNPPEDDRQAGQSEPSEADPVAVDHAHPDHGQ